MVDNDDFPRPEKLLRDYDGTESINRSPTRVADDMSVALLEAESTGRV